LKDLGNGLVIRRATPDDTDALVDFNGIQHSGNDEPDVWARRETLEMMSGRHPNIKPEDFAIIEDTSTGEIVSSLCLIPRTWSYEGIPFDVGQIEFVATHPDYRSRGLVRELMDVAHGWSAERGQMVNVITGIPHYYRQFGYEYAFYTRGGRSTQGGAPKLKDDQEESVSFRPFQESDAPFVTRLWQERSSQYLVDTVFDDDTWRYQFLGRDDVSAECRIIESPKGESVGWVVHPDRNWARYMTADNVELEAGVSWMSAVPSILRYLEKTGRDYVEQWNAEQPEKDPIKLESIGLNGMMPDDPLHKATQQLLPIERKPWAIYVRVPDIPDFIRHVTPVLEKRLANSIMAGHTGEVKISFARGGFRMAFEDGKLGKVEPWGPTKENGWNDKGRNALFPELTLLKLLFGSRSVDELCDAFPDVQAGSEQRTLLSILFPKQPSRIQFV
jgi:predicted N-acetyltransferase YhbS